jgi:hypothetical protein
MNTARMHRFLALLLAAMLLCACTSIKPYQAVATWPAPCFPPLGAAAAPACVRFVEYDDFGNVFRPEQLNDTVLAADAVARQKGIVVVYVHGWEHNAQSRDSDLQSFYRAMQKAQVLASRASTRRTVLGIYVGWRGKSLEIPGLSKVTFWERKTTAQSVGDGAVFELFRKLAYARENNPESRLVLIGHSFGATVTYASVFHSITAQIIEDPKDEKDAQQAGRDTRKRWDLVVLINPAFEAMQLRPHIDLARTYNYVQAQLPHLVLITTQADWATRIAFPAGRYVRSLFNSYYGPDSADMYRQAAGHYLPYITHQLVVDDRCKGWNSVGTGPKKDANFGILINEKSKCYGDTATWLDPAKNDTRAVRQTRCVDAGDCTEVAGKKHFMRAPERMPVWNIRTTAGVMSGHNDIWNPTMHAFLVQLMLSMVGPPPVAAPPPH